MLRSIVAASLALSSIGLAACSQEGSAERAGENMDSAIEEAAQGDINRGDGPLESAGEAVDQATGRENADPVDSIHDATDDNPNTQP